MGIKRASPSATRRIIIIGLGTGGLFASKAASRINRNAEITIIERRAYDMFSPCGLPYALEGKIESFEDLKHTVPTTKQLSKLLSHEVLSIDTQDKKVEVKNLRTGETSWREYDSLVIATGSRPKILPIPGAHELLGRGVYVFTNPEEAQELKEATLRSKKAVVIGGGAQGLEIAFALKELGLEVGVTKKSPPPFPRSLDPDMGKIISKYLESEGLEIWFGKSIDRINGIDRVESVEIAGETIPADLVVMAVGVSPEKSLAEKAGITVDRGGIVTDERLQTSVKDVYAIGDCAQTFSGVDGKPINMTLATAAFKQATVAGINAAGGDAVYDGDLGTFVSFIGDLEIACTGYNTPIAERNGFEVISGRANMQIKPKWMPGAKGISVKILVDVKSGRIIGGQSIGEEGAAWRVNIISLAIRKKMCIDEFCTLELAYCPAVSELYDPLQAAADVALRRYNRKKK
jgi:NADPH-dependent 2,4-dienoyl-CoA reductase/sulfur reductase-like enzyme